MNESSASCHSGHLDASDLLTPTYTPYITITNPDGTTPSVDEVVSLDIPVSVNYHALMENYDGTILPYRQQKSYQNLLEAQRQTSYGTLFQYQQLLEDGTKGLRTDRGVVKSGGFGTPVDPANLWATQYSGRIFTEDGRQHARTKSVVVFSSSGKTHHYKNKSDFDEDFGTGGMPLYSSCVFHPEDGNGNGNLYLVARMGQNDKDLVPFDWQTGKPIFDADWINRKRETLGTARNQVIGRKAPSWDS